MMTLAGVRLRAFAFAAALASVALPIVHAQKGNTGSDCSTFPCGRFESIVQTTIKQSWTPLGSGSSFYSD